MVEPGWTRGAWIRTSETLRGGVYWTVTRTGRDERIDIHEDDNGKEDTSLIAAAPDLYDALERLIDELIDKGEASAEAQDDAIVALAKARGE